MTLYIYIPTSVVAVPLNGTQKPIRFPIKNDSKMTVRNCMILRTRLIPGFLQMGDPQVTVVVSILSHSHT